MEILDSLWRASWQGALVAGGVWLLCRYGRLSAAARCSLWWLVSLKLLIDLAGLPALELPLLPAAERVGEAAPSIAAPASAPGVGPAVPHEVSAAAVAIPPAGKLPWRSILLTLWGTGVAVQGGWLLREHLRLGALRRRAATVRDPEVLVLFVDLVRRLGLRREPRLLASADVASPQVVGLFDTAILLPAAARDLPPADLEMALCHELAHLSRRDLWWGWVPAAAERLFFFHPMAGFAAREYALAREAACDARVLEVLDAAPKAYGRLLLKLGVAPRAAAGAAAGAASSWIHLKRRLLMLNETTSEATPRRSRAWLWLAAPVALVALLPLQLVRADDPEPSEAAPVAKPAVTRTDSSAKSPELAEADGVDNLLGMRPRLAKNENPLLAGLKTAWNDGANGPWNKASFVITRGQDSTVMSGTRDDLRAARKLGKDWGTDVVWFERNGKQYAIRDAATVAKAQKLFEPQAELGEKQGALGKQQGALGEEQGNLGARQAKIGEDMAKLAEKEAAEAMRGDGAGQEAFEARMKELEEKMEELGRQQEALGAKQEALGAQQEELGGQQEKLAREAEKQLEALIDEAMKNGLAQEVER